MAGSGFQLTTFLYGLGAGHLRVPPPPASAPNRTAFIPDAPGAVKLDGQGTICLAVQHDQTSCGNAATAVALAAVNEQVASWLGGTNSAFPAELLARGERAPDATTQISERFQWIQQNLKALSNARSLWPFAWPNKAGTPPWGAAKVMTLGAGVNYRHRLVVNTSMRQRARTLTAAAVAADLGFPVLLYVGGDSNGGWKTSVPRHVVVLHAGPAPEVEVLDEPVENDLEARLTKMAAEIKERLKAATSQVFNPGLVIYEPAFGNNTAVTLDELVNNLVPPSSLGGWPHIVWMVLPTAS